MESIGGVSIHVIDETENMSNRVTDKPLEDGASISDNIYQEPISINIKFVVPRNGKEVAEQLRKLRDSKQVYKYTGVDFSYPNMAIKSLSIPRNKNIKDGFEGSMQLQQVKIVEETSRITKLGTDPMTNKPVQKDNKEAPKRDTKGMEVPSTNQRALALTR